VFGVVGGGWGFGGVWGPALQGPLGDRSTPDQPSWLCTGDGGMRKDKGVGWGKYGRGLKKHVRTSATGGTASGSDEGSVVKLLKEKRKETWHTGSSGPGSAP